MVMPYVDDGGAWTRSDVEVLYFFNDFVADGLLETVFPAADLVDGDDFLAFAKHPAILMAFIYADDQPAGFVWLSDIKQKWALGNFALLKWTWGKRTLNIGHMVLDYWFGLTSFGSPVLETITGVIPAWNKRAVHYVQKIGFQVLGDIPIGDQAITVSYITRGMNHGR